MTPSFKVLAAGLLLGLLPAAAQTLILNGKVASDKTIIVGGRTYVPLSALSALGIQVSTGSGVTSLSSAAGSSAAGNGAGGANQKASVAGCLGEWLFNGVWRVRVTKVEPANDRYYGDGWGVTVEIKNGTTQTLTMDNGGIYYNGAVNLAFADGDSWSKSWREGWQDKTYAKLLQGSGTVYTFEIFPESKLPLTDVQAKPPQKFLLEDVKKLPESIKGVGFTVPDPSFRVDLTCKKS